MDSGIIFIEHSDEQVTDKPHCGGCNDGPTVTDKPHCGGCDDGPALVTDKPHCSDCGER